MRRRCVNSWTNLPGSQNGGGRFLALLLLVFIGVAGCRYGPKTIFDNVETETVKIVIEQEGFYRVSARALEQVGLAAKGLAPSSFKLSEAGQEVPFVVSEGALIFYGRAAEDRYTPTRTYILRSGVAGQAMDETPVAPAASDHSSTVRQTLHIEENLLYDGEVGAADHEDKWLWQTVPQGQTYTIQLDLPTLDSGPAELRMHLWGVTHNPEVQGDHDFDLIINGRNVGTISWEGRTHFTAVIQLPRGVLKHGENEVIIDNSTPGASFLDIMELDWLELDYAASPRAVQDRIQFTGADGQVALSGFSGRPLLFEVGLSGSPTLLTGWEYSDADVLLDVSEDMRVSAIGPDGFLSASRIEPLLSSKWHDPENQADLIILTTAELAPALAPLVEARAADNISAVVVPVEEVYDSFGHGAQVPASINAFITYAYNNWRQPRPQYLLIVGDATYDYRNYLGTAPRNQIPAPMVPVAYGGETVSDSRLVDVDGDFRPDLAVGRWPVSRIEDSRNLVLRTLAYENTEAGESVLFTADGTEARFKATAYRLKEQANLSEEQFELLADSTAEDLALRWNHGTWLTAYIGHGSVQQWGREELLGSESVDDLHSPNQPIVLQLTCLTGLFAHPELISLSEEMLLSDRGPVLLIAATSLTLSEHQEAFALPLLQSLSDQRVTRIGDAFLAAQRSLDVENPGLREIVDTFVLLGDPSARIVRPQT